MTKRLILCDCLGTQRLNPEALSLDGRLECSRIYSELCMGQIDQAAKELAAGEAILCCMQERARFEELAAEIEAPEPAFLDLRDRAGWSADEASSTPKMQALVAEAILPAPTHKSVDVVSEGICLIIGSGEVALKAAEEICDALSVTVLLTDDAMPPFERRFDIVRGRLKRASGALGGFEVTIDALQQQIPGGRGELAQTEPRNGGRSACDIILDLSGEKPLFPAGHKREGYLRADPKSASAVSQALLDAVQLVGTFEKPLYVMTEPLLCAHSRACQSGCTRCLDSCPTGAIQPDGDHVSVDPMICAGCGGCSALCPSGAISYDAPPVSTSFRRIETLARGFRETAGAAPRLLVHDDSFGREMIALAARFGRGLPADVIPMEHPALASFGHAEMLGALGAGFAAVDIMLSPQAEREVLEQELALAEAIAGQGCLRLLEPAEPDQLSDALFGTEIQSTAPEPVLLMGTRRQVARVAALAIRPHADILPLPDAAPYGKVEVNTDACTLCLSCVSLCPSGALADNPDLPQLRFQEDACLQCGLCANICPEDAITLTPQLNLTDAALSQRILHEEEPFTCVECGKPFGVKSTIEKITEKLAGKHGMFENPDAARMIQMCDDCRVNAQFHSQDNPFSGGERPRPRTTEDYYLKRRDH